SSLLAFPTRRSSDLADHRPAGGADHVEVLAGSAAQVQAEAVAGAEQVGQLGRVAGGALGVELVVPLGQAVIASVHGPVIHGHARQPSLTSALSVNYS